MRMSIQQPSWHLPERQTSDPVLKVYNSLTKSKTEFIPNHGRHVKWYNCGPTVYDASHMGHARNYVTQDVLRRIMSDYFGYDVYFVMNVTDIDDKIIVRARQNYLLDAFRADTSSLSTGLITQIRSAWQTHLREKLGRSLPEAEKPIEGREEEFFHRLQQLAQDKVWKQGCLEKDEKFDMNFSSAERTSNALQKASSGLQNGHSAQAAAQELIDECKDILAPALDAQSGATITDPSISKSLAAHWEGKFFDDMARLNVREPDMVTRVTEYVPAIVTFVEKIIQNGYAYEAQGSVYFDTRAFDAADGHYYAKLEPWSKGNRELLEDAEGSLFSKVGAQSTSDFALWKASKPGEPSWPSPWGPGRPGWHIECSVMASAILGDSLDIHSGGVDLAFPHHDNELAQSEAYHECSSWVNYFLHTGHLHIEGLKMSKSLKNFITIDEILKKHSARQLRLAFLTQLWNARMDFSEALMTGEVRNIETTFNNFFTVVKALVFQNQDYSEANGHHYETLERELTSKFHESQRAFRIALCDSFNTPAALDVLRDLVSQTNIYLNSRGRNIDIRTVERIAKWISKMLRMFGLGEGEQEDLGWGQNDQQMQNITNKEEILMPYLRSLSSFRDGVRRIAMQKSPSVHKDILALCDKLRDTDLIPLGVALDDQEDGKALVKLMPPAELMRVREEKRAQLEAKASRKAAVIEAERLKRLQKLEKGRVGPEQLFRPPNVSEGLYSSWDDRGIPLTDGSGKELSKNQSKKLQKDWDLQNKLHHTWLKEQSN